MLDTDFIYDFISFFFVVAIQWEKEQKISKKLEELEKFHVKQKKEEKYIFEDNRGVPKMMMIAEIFDAPCF